MRIALLTLAMSVALSLPTIAFAQLVPCDGVNTKCDFAALITLFDNILNFLILISIPIAAVMFAYAGWLYLSAGGNTEKVKKAHGIFAAVAIGIIIILVAWLIVNTILEVFTGEGLDDRQDQFPQSVDTARRIG